MRFFLNSKILIEIINQKPDGVVKIIFGSSGAIVAFGSISSFPNVNSILDETIGSEKWFSEDSDLFRFEKNGTLHSIVLAVPPRNASACPVFPENEVGFFSMHLPELNQSFIIPPQEVRFFDPQKRELYCFTKFAKDIKLRRFLVALDFSLLFDDKNLFVGWILVNPIEKMAATFQDLAIEDRVDQYTYDIFADFFNLVSDNQCDKFDDDMNLVVQNLLIKILEMKNLLNGIIDEKRRSRIIQVINELKNYFC